VPLLTSPRNSVEGQESLLQTTKCRKIVYSAEMEEHVKDIQRAVPEIQTFEIPGLEELMYPKEQPKPYKSRHNSHSEAVCLVLHTSGSTGMSLSFEGEQC
jgi:acyl-coenzyme A synthetase/AMP-(fatty) acid ligase